jgi:hypothetical protein
MSANESTTTLTLPTLGALAIFRNEAQLVFEWLLHLTSEGVSQFVLLDHKSVDGGADIVKTFSSQWSTRVDIQLYQVRP